MKKLYIMPHFGLGDVLLMIGGIRYYANIYNEVIVACLKDKIENIKLFLRDVSNVKIEEPIYWEDNIIKKYNVDKIYFCGHHKHIDRLTGIIYMNDVDIIPDCFYRDIDLDPKIRIEYFYFQPTIESELLYNLIKDRSYIFIHNTASESVLDTKFLIDKKVSHLLINCSMNMYTKDEFEYALAERFVNRYVIHYSKVIENADEIHVIDSSINVFVQQLDLSKVNVKKIYIRGGREYGSFIQPDFEQIQI